MQSIGVSKMNTKSDQEIYNYWIGGFLNFSAKKILAILNLFGSSKELFYASDKAMEEICNICSKKGVRITKRDMELLKSRRDINLLMKSLEYLKEHSIDYVTLLDNTYPDKLRHIYNPPFLLYLKGNPFPVHKKAIAIIGARECSAYGKEIARNLAGALAREDIVIISGLARGVDSYAHQGCLLVEGSTYGILGCGIDICYPKENINIYMDMQKKGGVISEYGPGIKPLAYNFPMRNRIISALSDGIVIIEAREKSGSLITVDMGLDQGKNIYAVPGRITDKLSMGCNNLIKMGAKVVTSPQDILEDFSYYCSRAKSDEKDLNIILNKEEEAIYNLLSLNPRHIDQLVDLSGISIDKLMEYLLSLELKNFVDQPRKNYYIRKEVW